ncbi:S8 family peptidase [Virgisporangium aliadipatigenens]|nr:S8 family peptidase [Virgisporangium aliadipatigenens]
MSKPRRFAAKLLVAGSAAAAAAAFMGAGAALAAPAEGTVVNAGAAGAIKDSYIVTLKAGTAESAQQLAARFGGTVNQELDTVHGFTARLTEKSARRLAGNPAVATVEQDRAVALAGTQAGAEWGLDRVDQRDLPLAGSYVYPNTAANVTAYVLDTGVRLTHSELAGRASSGYDFIDKDADASDCQGHGTHVAGTIAGKTYGVAKAAKIVSVRVLNCSGSGSYSGIIAGIDWVTKNAKKPAVANMSLGGASSATLDTALRNSIAAGVTYAVAAGNESKDACTVSPARTDEAITVGATDSTDRRAAFSNFGTCLDIFAPGVSILSATKDSDTSTGRMSGTSMATPHVAGAAAVYLSANPAATPAQVRDALVNAATPNKVTDPMGSANRLLYLTTGAVTTPTTPVGTCTASDGTDRAIADRATVESKLAVAGCTGTASATSTVEVHVKHTDRGDLALTLVAPDGKTFPLKAATIGDNVSNLDATYTVNLSTKTRNGTWRLRITDAYSGDRGTLDRWTLTL